MIITLDHVNHTVEIKNDTDDGKNYLSKITFANVKHTEGLKDILENIFHMMDKEGKILLQEIEEDDVQTVIGEW